MPTNPSDKGFMILEHCVSLLLTGKSAATQRQFDGSAQVYFKLQSGITAKRIDSMHTALLMIEMIKVSQPSIDQVEQYNRFNHFVDYIFDRFSEPVAMALVKYAIADRKLVIRKLAESASWSRISKVFKPVMLDDSQDPIERFKFSRFERIYKRLHGCKPISEAMHEYVIDHQNIND
jgi:hypothetical protein